MVSSNKIDTQAALRRCLCIKGDYMCKFKYIISVLSAILIAFLATTLASADTLVTLDGYTYSQNQSGLAVLMGWDNSSDILVVPHYIGGVAVAEVGNSAFKNDDFIKSVDFSNAKRMYTIGQFAFADSILEGNLIIPSRVTKIGTAAFEGCSNLTSVQFSSDGGIVPTQCFNNCTSLESVILTSYINQIEQYAFQNCTSLRSVTIPKSVTSINSTAFKGCDDFVINCYHNSYAEQFAKDNGIDYEVLDPLIGDANDDGVVDIRDVTAIQKHLVDAEKLSDYGETVSDVNGDNEVTIRDATMIQMKIVGIISDF